MRINEYKNLNEFISEYETGKWDPSSGQWEGLEFRYKNKNYRLCHAPMYETKPPILENGEVGKLLLAKKINNKNSSDYIYLDWFSCMEDLLKSKLIEGRKFSDVIMDDDTEILAKD